MRLGINLPSSAPDRAMGGAFDFGRAVDLWGRTATPAWKARDGQQLLDDLAAMYDAGVRAVRWFLLGAGATLGRPRFLGARNRLGTPRGADAQALWRDAKVDWYAAASWSFAVPDGAVCRTVVDDVVRMLRLMQRFNAASPERARDPIRVLPSWVDFRFFQGPGRLRMEWSTPSADDAARYDLRDPVAVERWFALRHLRSDPLIAGGRMDVLLDPAQRRAFYARVVAPTLEAVAADEGLRDQVLFWEVGNELDMMIPGAPEDVATAHASVAQVPRLTRALYAFVSEMVLLHRGAPVTVAGAAPLRANVARPFRTTVGWLYWDGVPSLQQTLLDRAWLHRHRGPDTGEVAVEDALQYHAYMGFQADPTPVVYAPSELAPEASLRAGLATRLGRPPFNQLAPPRTQSGWRRWPSAQEVREFAVEALGADLHALMGFAPDVDVRVDDDTHILCVVGEMHLLPASGDPGEGRPPERWVKHFAVPSALSDGDAFYVRPLRWDPDTATFVPSSTQGLAEQVGLRIAWVYQEHADTLTGRLFLLHTLGYSWALPWAWNLGDVERPLEHFLGAGETPAQLAHATPEFRARLAARRRQERPAAFWRRLRLGEQLRAFADAVVDTHHT